MKRRINLFSAKKQRSESVLFTEQSKFTGTVIGIILFVVFLLFTILQIQLSSQVAGLQDEKKILLEATLGDKNSEAKLSYFVKKKEQLKNYLKDDAEFLPYYNLLKDILAFSSESPILESMTIDKKKTTTFIVRFEEYAPAYEFLKYIESASFLDNFNELRLDSFSLTRDNTNSAQGYQLRFHGKFKVIDGSIAQK